MAAPSERSSHPWLIHIDNLSWRTPSNTVPTNKMTPNSGRKLTVKENVVNRFLLLMTSHKCLMLVDVSCLRLKLSIVETFTAKEIPFSIIIIISRIWSNSSFFNCLWVILHDFAACYCLNFITIMLSLLECREVWVPCFCILVPDSSIFCNFQWYCQGICIKGG